MPETTFSDGDVVTAAQLNQIEDQIVVTCTSTTRPTGVEGRMIFETDTNQLRLYDGSTWRLIAGSAWVDFSPTFNNISTSATDGAYRFADGGMFILANASVSGAATGTVTVDVPASETKRADGLVAIGLTRYINTGGTDAVGQCYATSGASVITLTDNDDGGVVNATNPFTWASGDFIRVQMFLPL